MPNYQKFSIAFGIAVEIKMKQSNDLAGFEIIQ